MTVLITVGGGISERGFTGFSESGFNNIVTTRSSFEETGGRTAIIIVEVSIITFFVVLPDIIATDVGWDLGGSGGRTGRGRAGSSRRSTDNTGEIGDIVADGSEREIGTEGLSVWIAGVYWTVTGTSGGSRGMGGGGCGATGITVEIGTTRSGTTDVSEAAEADR
jgi:hypothetical protein